MKISYKNSYKKSVYVTLYLKLYVSDYILQFTSWIGPLTICSEPLNLFTLPLNNIFCCEFKIFSRSTTIEKEVSHSSDLFLESNGSTLTFVLVFNIALHKIPRK